MKQLSDTNESGSCVFIRKSEVWSFHERKRSRKDGLSTRVFFQSIEALSLFRFKSQAHRKRKKMKRLEDHFVRCHSVREAYLTKCFLVLGKASIEHSRPHSPISRMSKFHFGLNFEWNNGTKLLVRERRTTWDKI